MNDARMTGTRWARLEALFEQALGRPVDQRAAFLDAACAGDEPLRGELELMIAADAAAYALEVERFLVDTPPVDRAADAETSDPRLGACLGAWRLVSVLGRGGMGTVYRAERADGHYTQDAAVKVAREGLRDGHGRERFRTERQVLARLRHANIASLLDGGFAPDGAPYLVMELVDGVPITRWSEAARPSIDERLRLLRVVCDAVQHAHGALVVHRDLKPSNIFVTRSGEVKLLDFGIAKLLDPGAWDLEQPATVTEWRVLTPEYAAPEQLAGGHITAATDVYTLGVVLYELLTGSRPRFPTALAASSSVEPIPAPSERLRESGADPALVRRVRGDLDRIVLTALREEPERRYVSAGQLGEELGRFLDGRPVLAQPDTATYRLRRFVRRHRVGVAAAAALVASLVAFGVISTIQARALAEQGRIAREERDKAERVVRVLVELFETTNPSIRPDGDRITIGEFLAGAEERALARLAGAPVVRAKLQQVFGLISSTRGSLAAAGTALEEALDAERRLLGPDHPDSLESLHALGEVHREAGELPRARSLLEESLERHRRIYGESDARTARALFALAPVFASSDLPRAGALLEEALAIRRRVLPADDPAIAGNLAALGDYHRRRGEFARTRALYREALALARRAGDTQSTRFVGLMNDYGSFLGEMGDHAEAAEMQREAIALGRKVLGVDSMPVANLLNNLGVTQSLLRRWPEAEATFREAFDRHVAIVGERHWRTRNAARNVGRSLALQQKYAEALEWMDRALAIQVPAETQRDAGRYGISAQRAAIVFRLGRRDEAVRDLRAHVAALDAMPTADAEQVVVWVSLLLARALNDTGRPAEAESILAKWTSWLERFPASHPRRAEAACERARARALQGAADEARAIFDACLPIYRNWGLAERETVSALVAASESARRASVD